MFDVDSGEQPDLIVKSNSSDGRTNRYWLRGSRPLDASYWDRYSHNVTDSQWMLIFCERNCPPWQSWFLWILTRPANLRRTELLPDWLSVFLYFNVAKAKLDVSWQAWMDYVTMWTRTYSMKKTPGSKQMWRFCVSVCLFHLWSCRLFLFRSDFLMNVFCQKFWSFKNKINILTWWLLTVTGQKV